jgi:hypothetical protein
MRPSTVQDDQLRYPWSTLHSVHTANHGRFPVGMWPHVATTLADTDRSQETQITCESPTVSGHDENSGISVDP